MQKPLKLFRSLLIPVGLFFLINPYISLLDILPDFIGYLLIYAGISELAEIDDRLTLSSQKLLFLSFVSFSRLVMFFVFASSDSSTKMMLSFSLGIVECLLLMLFVSDFFGGFEYLLQRHDGYDALSVLPDSRFLTRLFFILKVVLGFIPELVALPEVEAITNISSSEMFMDIVRYKPYAILLFSLIIVVFGIWWYYNILRYFRIIRKDERFISSCGSICEDKLTEQGKELKRVKYSFLLVSVGFVFFLNINIENLRLIYDYIGTGLITLGLYLIRRYIKTSILPLALVAAVLQIGSSAAMKALGVTRLFVLDEFPIASSVILAVMCGASSIAVIAFMCRVFTCFAEASSAFGIKSKQNALPKVCLTVLTLYYCATLFVSAYPVSYEWLSTFRTLLIILFVILSIRSYWTICDEYASED